MAQGGPPFATAKIADGVYHFSYHGTNGMFVVADDGVVVVDPMSPKAAPVYIEEIRKVTSKPIKYLVYSHAHVDHIAGGKAFKDQGAEIIAHEAVQPRLAMLKDPEIVAPDITFKDRMSVPVKGKRIELMHYGPVHGPGYTFIHLPDEKVLSAIDVVYPKRLLFYYLPDYQPRTLLGALREVQKLDYDVVISGHGPLANKQDLVEFTGYLDDMITQVGGVYRKYRYEPPAVQLKKALEEVNLDKYKEWGRFDTYRDRNIEGVLWSFTMGF
jgi:glyoxylase-like metal-dependent hydrolase (beta-lactamase superfamily II)